MNWASRYVGAPFVDGGRDWSGLDCWGVVQLVYRECLGIELPQYGEISAADLLRVRRQIASGAQSEPWFQVTDVREFDVAVMRLPSGRAHGHVGVMVDAQHVLHAEKASGVAIERVNSSTLCHRVIGFWRHSCRDQS